RPAPRGRPNRAGSRPGSARRRRSHPTPPPASAGAAPDRRRARAGASRPARPRRRTPLLLLPADDVAQGIAEELVERALAQTELAGLVDGAVEGQHREVGGEHDAALAATGVHEL